jgi:hypothetical protein
MKTDDHSKSIEDAIMEEEEQEIEKREVEVLNNEIKKTISPSSNGTDNNFAEKLKNEFDDLDEIKEDFVQSENMKRVRFSQQIESTLVYEMQKNIYNKEKSGKIRSAYNRMKNVKAVRAFLNRFKRIRY